MKDRFFLNLLSHLYSADIATLLLSFGSLCIFFEPQRHEGTNEISVFVPLWLSPELGTTRAALTATARVESAAG